MNRIVIGHHQVIRSFPPGTGFRLVPVPDAAGDDLEVLDAAGKVIETIGWADWNWAGNEGEIRCAGPTVAPGTLTQAVCPICAPAPVAAAEQA